MRISPILLSKFKSTKAPVTNDRYAFMSNSKINTLSSDTFQKSPILQSNDISFGYEFALKKPKGLSCAYCGKPVLSQDEIYEFSELKGSQLVERLESYKKLDPEAFSNQNLEALNLFEKTAINNPEKTGKELLPIAYTRARNRMLMKQMAVYSSVEKMAAQLHSQELLDYISQVKNQDVALNPDISFEELSDFLANKIHVQFRREIIDNVLTISKQSQNIVNQELWHKVTKKINELPSSKNDPDAFLVKYISKALRKDTKLEKELLLVNDDEVLLFFSKLLSPFTASAEHIKPFSHNGACDASNYLLVHSSCNCKRSNTPWGEYVIKRPYILKNILRSLREISDSATIKNQLYGFSVPRYVKAVSAQMKRELIGYSSKDIKAFKRNLDNLCEFSLSKANADKICQINTSVRPRFDISFNNDNSKQAVYRKLKDILSLPSDKIAMRNRLLEELTLQTGQDIIKQRRQIFGHLKKDIGVGSDDLNSFIDELKAFDPILNTPNGDIKKLAQVFDKKNLENYYNKLNSYLTYTFASSKYSPEVYSYAKRLPSLLMPDKKPLGILFKILMQSRMYKNEYNVELIKKYFED